MWTYIAIGLVCLSGLSHAQDNVQKAIQRSCDLNDGSVCIPTACSSSKCSLWKDAVCVDDRCGCEARFFNWMSKEKTFHDISKMCSSSNYIMNFANFTVASEKTVEDEDTSLTATTGEVASDATVIKYFREFNLLTTEILMDIADYLKSVSQKYPTRANIERLSLARRTLSSLKRVVGQVNDEEAGRINRDAIKKNHKVAVDVMQDILSDEGSYADAVSSGKVAISDKNAQNKLKEALQIQSKSICFIVCLF